MTIKVSWVDKVARAKHHVFVQCRLFEVSLFIEKKWNCHQWIQRLSLMVSAIAWERNHKARIMRDFGICWHSIFSWKQLTTKSTRRRWWKKRARYEIYIPKKEKLQWCSSGPYFSHQVKHPLRSEHVLCGESTLWFASSDTWGSHWCPVMVEIGTCNVTYVWGASHPEFTKGVTQRGHRFEGSAIPMASLDGGCSRSVLLLCAGLGRALQRHNYQNYYSIQGGSVRFSTWIPACRRNRVLRIQLALPFDEASWTHTTRFRGQAAVRRSRSIPSHQNWMELPKHEDDARTPPPPREQRINKLVPKIVLHLWMGARSRQPAAVFKRLRIDACAAQETKWSGSRSKRLVMGTKFCTMAANRRRQA